MPERIREDTEIALESIIKLTAILWGYRAVNANALQNNSSDEAY